MLTTKTKTALCLSLLVSFTASVSAESSSDSINLAGDRAEDCVVRICTQLQQSAASGSGFFINEQGLFLTCDHIVDQAMTVHIQIPSMGTQLIEAVVVRVCPEQHLALLRIADHELDAVRRQLDEIHYLKLGDSDTVNRADTVLAFAHGQKSVKSAIGVVIGREQQWIQIEAAIKPCTAGGPLLNNDGEVIGINYAGISEIQDLVYIIPINSARNILRSH